MKKIFIAMLALAAAACAKNEVVSLNQEAIGFDNAFVENSTRSVKDPSYTNDAGKMFSDFAVYGCVENASLFNNVLVSQTMSNDKLNSAWKYENTQYWITGAKYNFAAIAPKANGENDVFSVAKDADGNYVGTTVLPFTNTDGTNDLLYAQNAQVVGPATDNNGTVAFTFRHILSKVKFSFENGYNASTATIKVYDVKIENAWRSATATLGVNSTAWGSHADNGLVLEFGAATSDTAESNTAEAYAYEKTLESYNELLLIPGAAPQVTYTKENADVTENAYKVTFKVVLLVNGTEVKEYSHTAYVAFTPVAGNSYDIKATINAENIDPKNEQEPIEFTVTEISDWNTENQDQTLPL
ncbi:MAG: fimbrillin family protein [Alistipes sp.]|nr:fimbrillin family protein [Alistipes sp.]